MHTFADAFLDSVGELDGAILKSRSPSCGVKDVKVYPANAGGVPSRTDVGLFARALMDRWPELAVEDEVRLADSAIREHFVERVLMSASSRRTGLKKANVVGLGGTYPHE